MVRRRRELKRETLPDTRDSITHRVHIESRMGGEKPHSIYLIVGVREDGSPCEVFIQVGKQGSTLRGLMDTCAIQMSWLLQYGVRLPTIVEQFRGMQFEPFGSTSNPHIPECSSIIDYVVRWLELRFLVKEKSR